MRYFLIFFCLFIFSNIQAQEKLLTGRIIIDIDDESAEGIYITNKTTKITTITDLTGSFRIHGEAGDELLIQSYLYESRKFIITQSVMDKGFVNIHLNLQPIVLEEAVIMQKLTGYLDIDAKYDTKEKVTKLKKDLGLPLKDKQKDSVDMRPWNEYTPFTLNVEGILGAITGDTRRKRNLYYYEDKEERIVNIKDYFGETYFVNDLKIPKEKIRDFLFYAFETSKIPEYYTSGNYLSIMVELSKASKVYQKRLDSWSKSLPGIVPAAD